MPEGTDPTERLARATTWLPMLVSALLVVIVAVFILAAPNQVVTPHNSGYLIASVPTQVDQAQLDQTAMQ